MVGAAGIGNSRCKSPGAGVCLVSLRNSEEVCGVKEGKAVGEATEEKTELKCVCVCVYAHVHVCSGAQSCPALCSPMDMSGCQAPLSMKFSRQEHWSGLPLPPPGDLSKPGIEPKSLVSSALAGRFFITSAT